MHERACLRGRLGRWQLPPRSLPLPPRGHRERGRRPAFCSQAPAPLRACLWQGHLPLGPLASFVFFFAPVRLFFPPWQAAAPGTGGGRQERINGSLGPFGSSRGAGQEGARKRAEKCRFIYFFARLVRLGLLLGVGVLRAAGGGGGGVGDTRRLPQLFAQAGVDGGYAGHSAVLWVQ